MSSPAPTAGQMRRISHACRTVPSFKKRLTYETERSRLSFERLQLPYSGIQAVTVISTSSSGKFNIASTVVLAGLLVGKNFAYSSL
jgi:hypothetical protein